MEKRKKLMAPWSFEPHIFSHDLSHKCRSVNFVTKFSEIHFLVSNLSLTKDWRDYTTDLSSAVPGLLRGWEIEAGILVLAYGRAGFSCLGKPLTNLIRIFAVLWEWTGRDLGRTLTWYKKHIWVKDQMFKTGTNVFKDGIFKAIFDTGKSVVTGTQTEWCYQWV